MDDAVFRSLFRFILIPLLSVISLSALGLDLEYISPKKKIELEHEFSIANAPVATQMTPLAHAWKCDMYGVRTRLQVKRGMNLYKWTQRDGYWQNLGAQLPRQYQAEGADLVGKQDKFIDRVRMTSKGTLIAQLSVSDPTPQILAYSTCTSIQE